MDLSAEIKEKLKADRLQQYLIRMYNVRMDLEAYRAVGDLDRLITSENALDELNKAYNAIEAM